MQAIGQFDQDDTDVLGHGEHHLAEVLGLGLGPGFKLDRADLADTVDEVGHGIAELAGDVFLGDAGILDDVMEQPGHDAGSVHAHVGQDKPYRQGVGDIGVTGAPVLALVSLFGERIGRPDAVHVLRIEVGQLGDKGVGGQHVLLPDDPSV